MTRLLPWLLGAALVVAVLLGVGYCRASESSEEWAEDWRIADSTKRAKEAETVRAVAVTNATINERNALKQERDSLRLARQSAPVIVTRVVQGRTVLVPDTTQPDSVITIPAPVAARLMHLEGQVVALVALTLKDSAAFDSLASSVVAERGAHENEKQALRAQIKLLQDKPRDNGWRVVYGVGYAGALDVQARAFAHGPSVFVGIARPVPFPRIFPRRS